MESSNIVKTFSTIKIDVNKKELTEYFNDTGILVNNLTNVCIYINRQWYFYNQNIYYNDNPEKNMKIINLIIMIKN
jgi:hypothetical protein